MENAEVAAARVGHLITLGRLEEAERVARTALGAQPRHAGLLTALAAVLLNTRRYAEGLAAADTAAGLDPLDAQIHRFRALLLSALGRHGEAVVAVDEAAELAPHSVPVAVDQAWVLREGHRFDESVRAAGRAVTLGPLSPDAHVALAGARAARGDHHGARRSYTDALALDPEHVPALHDLAVLDVRERRHVDALGGIVGAGAARPASSAVLATAGRVVDLLLRRLQRVLLLPVAGLAALGWSIPPGGPSRAVAGTVLVVVAVLGGWTARRLPRGSWPVVRAALRADAGAGATAAAVGLCLVTFAAVAVTGVQVAVATLAFVLGFGALGLLYAAVVLGALAVRAVYRRVRPSRSSE